jgi:hypothetical protein
MRAAFLSEPKAAALRAINYAPELEALSRPRSGNRSAQLRSLLSSMGESYWAVFTRHDCQLPHGVELITQADMFAAQPEGRVIRRDSMPRPDQHVVKRWQILIAGAGQMGEGNLFGRSIIADRRLAGKYLGPHAVALTFPDSNRELNAWTYAFLNAAVGFKAIKACAFGTSVPGLRLDLLAEIPIPLPRDPAVLSRVAELVRGAMEQRETYHDELAAARGVLESLPEMSEARALCAERRARVVSWDGPLRTLSAWNVASSGGALAHLRRRWSGTLSDALEPDGVFNGPRFSRVTCERPHGIDFYSQRDVFLMTPIPRRIRRPAIPDRMLFVPEDAVLAGSHGQLTDGGLFGRVELASFAAHCGGVTQDLLRLLFVPKERACAFAFLSTIVGQRLLKSTAVGTSIPSMRLDLLREIPYPELSEEMRATVTQHLAVAEGARRAATESDAEAIRVVENEVVTRWLA